MMARSKIAKVDRPSTAPMDELVVVAASGKGKVYHRSSDEEFRRRWSACGSVQNGTRWQEQQMVEQGLTACHACWPE